MIERAGTGSFDYRLHDGEGVGRFQWYFQEQSTLPVAVQMWELPPGASEGMHAHPVGEPLEELYVVVSGAATMTVDGQTHELGPGDAVLAEVGSEHDLRNAGTDTVRVLVVWGTPGQADYSGYGMARASLAARRG